MNASRWRAVPAFASAVCVTSVAPQARASEGGDGLSVVVLEVAVDGDMPDHLRKDLSERVSTELGRTSAAVLSAAAGKSCTDASCAGTAAVSAGASHAVRTGVTLDGPDFDVKVEIVDASGTVVATSSDVCEVCGAEELGGTVTELAIKARKQLDALDTAPPVFVVQTDPPGAVVLVDGEPVGETPLEVEVAAGEHDVVVSKEGFIKQRQRLGFVDGMTERLELELQVLPAGYDDDVDRRRRGLRIGGWAGVGLGVAGVAAGAAMLATDGSEIASDCSGSNVDAEGDCRYVWNKTPGGIALTAAGGVALVAGAVLLGLGYKKDEPRTSARVRVRPTSSGVKLSF